MTSLRFTKGHGTENDFVLLFDERGDIALTPERVRFLCDRRAGIGADGVIRAVRADSLEAGKGLPSDTWFMDYWNADGTTSEMCGNGVRVFARFLEREAGVELGAGMEIGTRAGVRTVTSLGEGRYSVGMGRWLLGEDDVVVATPGLVPPRPAQSVDVGNPHHVVALASVEELEALDLGAPPDVAPAPPHGSNVEFVVTLGHRVADGVERGRVRMRVHERGVGETRSCGTGACAVALAVRSWAGAGAPDVWDIEVPGGEVTVRVLGDRTVLEGPAVLVADGEVVLPSTVA
ncbi:diaminopimelate epimerase [Demequina capsici]|uniref:Diaminopimelate epimerase n=1 Tax=Demequina capsici TaxID=3075620 RepID=A0AA96F5X1_9MICO|nr:diaminopimelate epimerase [Demequina sp. OYTSA14]WNM23372.1 diaminopimelate epimerase [Demequina sp. OYTSA14]